MWCADHEHHKQVLETVTGYMYAPQSGDGLPAASKHVTWRRFVAMIAGPLKLVFVS